MHRTRRIPAQPQLPPIHVHRVEVEHVAGEWRADAGDDLHRFHRLHAADDADQWRGDPVFRAVERYRITFRIETPVARRITLPRIENRDLALDANRRAGNER